MLNIYSIIYEYVNIWIHVWYRGVELHPFMSSVDVVGKLLKVDSKHKCNVSCSLSIPYRNTCVICKQ